MATANAPRYGYMEYGNAEAEPGSYEWAVAIRIEIQSGLHSTSMNIEALRRWLNGMRESGGWRQLIDVHQRQFPSFEAFCYEAEPLGLGMTSDQFKLLLGGDDVIAADQYDLAIELPHGHEVDNINLKRQPDGTNRGQALRRLRKSRRDLHARVLAGELSPHAAMIEAGFRKPTFTVPQDVDAAARILVKRFSMSERRKLAQVLLED